MRTKLEIRLDEGIRKLRLETFEKGFPFMIHDQEIAGEGFILEYPAGTMKLMKLAANNQDIVEIRSFNSTEIDQIRKRHNLSFPNIPELSLHPDRMMPIKNLPLLKSSIPTINISFS
ncbi:hypothetical protein [Dyadobacter luticola]|uniref:Uncharacterized protein n=1 Tax=Dyadobacter luticola TaxID=1979387 RepID=A0A5R9L5Q1_9BACT|nr:hypothetical protein [Dyadobacter luticola]TLV03768.1 hypothetical protein FEN17_09290 [Dyadobacter luticola]